MKKALIAMILVLLINISSVNAGRSIPLDFNEENSYIIPLYEKDRVFFEFDGDNHSMILDEIKERRVEFDLFIYQEKNKNIEDGDNRDAPIYIFADTVNLLKFDLDRDGVFDFKLDVLDYDQQKALIELTKIEETKENTTLSPINSLDNENNKPPEPENSTRFYNNIWFVSGLIGLVLVILIVILIDRFNKSKGKRWSYH